MAPVRSRWTNRAKRIKGTYDYVCLTSFNRVPLLDTTYYFQAGRILESDAWRVHRAMAMPSYVSLLRPDAAPLPNVEPLSKGSISIKVLYYVCLASSNRHWIEYLVFRKKRRKC